MKIDWFAVLDLGLAFGVILVLAFWELIALRRTQRRDREAEAKAEAEAKTRAERARANARDEDLPD